MREQLRNTAASVGESRAAARRRSEQRRSFPASDDDGGGLTARLREQLRNTAASVGESRRRTEEERAKAFFPCERRRRRRTHRAIARAALKHSCERRRTRRRTEEERAEAFFPLRATTTAADSPRDCASSSKAKGDVGHFPAAKTIDIVIFMNPPVPAGVDGKASDALLKLGRFFTRWEESDDGRVAFRKGGRAGDVFYRDRWSHDKVVRSTHGVNCTGSCSWKIYVRDGIITWEAQQTDYPSVGPDRPEYEPRGCPRGAAFSWYTYSPTRVRYPYARGVLLEMYREAKQRLSDPVLAWADVVNDPERRRRYHQARGKGGLAPCVMGRGSGDDRGGSGAHDQDLRTGSHLRLLTHSGDVDGLLLHRTVHPAHRWE